MVQSITPEISTLVTPHACNQVSDQFEPPTTNEMTANDAQRLLWELSDLPSTSLTSNQRQEIIQALDWLTSCSEYHTFGICADSLWLALHALEGYALHFHYGIPKELVRLKEASHQDSPLVSSEVGVYVKFNPRTYRYKIDTYVGRDRGVLITFQSDFEGDYLGTHGHFPLDLFDVIDPMVD
ncbi:MAG: DUF1824 family protein [Pseudanabaena sp. ELA607]|jgi:hypothetical protein